MAARAAPAASAACTQCKKLAQGCTAFTACHFGLGCYNPNCPYRHCDMQVCMYCLAGTCTNRGAHPRPRAPPLCDQHQVLTDVPALAQEDDYEDDRDEEMQNLWSIRMANLAELDATLAELDAALAELAAIRTKHGDSAAAAAAVSVVDDDEKDYGYANQDQDEGDYGYANQDQDEAYNWYAHDEDEFQSMQMSLDKSFDDLDAARAERDAALAELAAIRTKYGDSSA